MFKESALAAVLALSLAPGVFAEFNFDSGGRAAVLHRDLLTAAVPAPGKPAMAAPETVAGPPAPKEWTVMVYVNAKNDLEEFGLADVAEMERVGSSDKVNIVVELGRMSGYDATGGDWTGVRRYLIKKGPGGSSPVLEDFKADMGDWKELARFGEWAREKYPAKKYMLVVWNHGSGWLKTAGRRGARGISYDYETGSHISVPQLAEALKKIGRVDLLAFDACLMQMPEVIYEVRDYADYVAGSEETVPADGYAYDMFLEDLVKKPAMTAEALARAAADSFLVYCGYLNYKATQSLLRTGSFGPFLPLVNDWADSVIASGERELAVRAAAAAQKYYYWDNKDLYHFVQLVTAEVKDPAAAAKGKALMRFISEDMILLNGYTKPTSADSHGLAVYLPAPSDYNPAYEDLLWAKASKWDELIRWYSQN